MLHELRRIQLRYPRFFCNEAGCTHENGMRTEYFHEVKAVRHAEKTGHEVLRIVSLWVGDWTDNPGPAVPVAAGV